MEPQNPYQVPINSGIDHSRESRWLGRAALFCIGYYSLAAVYGARSAVSADPTGDFVFDAAFAILLCTWAITDARQRMQPIPRSQRIWFYVLASWVVPGYVVGTRR